MGQFHGNMNRFIVKAWVSEEGDLKGGVETVFLEGGHALIMGLMQTDSNFC